jgi:hypothetical protein
LSPEERLATIVAALEAAGVECLVMGGHAVRHYGPQRHTNDVDLTLAPEGWSDLTDRLVRTGLFPGGAPVEGTTRGRPGRAARAIIFSPAGPPSSRAAARTA